MASELDKFTYLTVYRQDYSGENKSSGIDPRAEPGKVDCKPKAYVGEAVGRPYESPLETCSCRPGGNIPPRGAFASGMPTNLEVACSNLQGRARGNQPPVPNKEELAEMMYNACEEGQNRGPCLNSPGQSCSAGKPPQTSEQPSNRPMPIGQFGGQFEGPVNRQAADLVPYASDKPCYCPPGKPESGPQDYGPAWIRERANEPRITGGNGVTISPEVSELIEKDPIAARVSCAPESEISRFDQPNTFMKKLYDKYPYLYQILRDTPPEELIARVFKDRFLSTYQVDYLHMGAGKEHFPKGGSHLDEKFVSPEGEPEPHAVPGCTYRPNKKSDFGKKKSGLKKKEVEADDEPVVVKEEPWISEYMASISKLGGEIITEKLFAIEASNRKASGKYSP